jgi:hypothetical protein
LWTAAGGGAVVQPAASAAAQAIIAAAIEGRNMWVIYLEVLLALGLVLFIVWWTMRGK